jgi:hypothetical protein
MRPFLLPTQYPHRHLPATQPPNVDAEPCGSGGSVGHWLGEGAAYLIRRKFYLILLLARLANLVYFAMFFPGLANNNIPAGPTSLL